MTAILPAWWVSWYSSSEIDEFELHSPWWVSGYDANDRTIICAAVRAVDEEAAYAAVKLAYDNGPADFTPRFCEPLTGSPFGGRWPKARWMDWDDEGRTCACPTHLKVAQQPNHESEV